MISVRTPKNYYTDLVNIFLTLRVAASDNMRYLFITVEHLYPLHTSLTVYLINSCVNTHFASGASTVAALRHHMLCKLLGICAECGEILLPDLFDCPLLSCVPVVPPQFQCWGEFYYSATNVFIASTNAFIESYL